MVVDDVIHHWVVVVASTEAGTEILVLSIWDLAAYFYDNDGLIDSTQPESMKRVFDFLTDLFDWVCLRTNTRKMVSMAYQPCHTPVRISVEAHVRLAMETGPTFWECQRMQVQCL